MATKKPKQAPEGAENTETKQDQKPADSATETKAEKPAKPPKDEKNGVTRPQSGATRQVWDIADEMAAKLERPPTRAEVTEKAAAAGIKEGTIHTQFGHWRKYYGLTTPKEERQRILAEAREAKEAEKAKKKAEKDAKAAETAAKKAEANGENAGKSGTQDPDE